MTDLATRLEAGPGSREDSDLVLKKMGWKPQSGGFGPTWWINPSNGAVIHYNDRPDPARLVDDGLALAGDDWEAILRDALYRMLCVQPDRSKQQLSKLPLFICAALVRAKEQEADSE